LDKWEKIFSAQSEPLAGKIWQPRNKIVKKIAYYSLKLGLSKIVFGF